MIPKYRWSSNAESAELDGVWVVMNVEAYTISTLSDVGGFIWSLLQQASTNEDIVSRVLTEYEAVKPRVEQDVSTFMGKMLEFGLVESVS